MNLDELKEEATKDLPIIDHEHMDQETYKNQIIKPKWLDYKTRFELLKIQANIKHTKLYREKWEYYGGKSDAKVYAAKPFDIRVLFFEIKISLATNRGSLSLLTPKFS